MGNICSCLPSKQEQAASHPFNAPGRTLDSARPAQQPGASSSNMGQAQSSKTAQGQTPIQASDAQPQRREIDAEERAARARAVEVKMYQSRPRGTLADNLLVGPYEEAPRSTWPKARSTKAAHRGRRVAGREQSRAWRKKSRCRARGASLGMRGDSTCITLSDH